MGVLLTYGLTQALTHNDHETLRAEIAAVYAAQTAAQLAEQKAHLIQHYEAHIHSLKTRHAETIQLTRRDSTNQSRAVLKG